MIRRTRQRSRPGWHSVHASARQGLRPEPLSSRGRVPTTEATMRTLGFRTHILLVIAGAVAVVSSLNRPWYGPPPAPLPDNSTQFDVHGPLQALLDARGRWVTATEGTTGWTALGISGQVIAGLAVVAALGSVGCLLPPVQAIVSVPLRYVSFAAFGATLWRVIDSPGPNTDLELRVGALIALVGAGMVWISAQGVAGAPPRKRVAPSFASSR